MLLPLSSHDDEDDIEDPRLPLVRQLLEYKRYKDAAQSLDSIAEIRSHYFTRGKIEDISSVEEDAAVFVRNVSLFDIATYFKTAMDNRPVISQYELHRESISIEDQKAKLLAFVDGDGILRFSSLMNRLRDKIEIIITFLAILDLIREEKILLIQNELFSDIEIQLISEKN
jgi:segregation and condensation protein A